MARPRREPRPRDAEGTRRTLLAAATAVFSEHGFAGARVDEVAARAAVNKRMIYAYFGDKEGLYREVLSSRLAVPGPAAAPAPAGARDALEALVRWYFRLLAGDPALARLLAWDLLSGAPRRQAILLDSVTPALDRVSELIRRAVAAGELDPAVRPEPFRAALVALCVGYFLQRPALEASRARGAPGFTDEAFLEQTCRLLFGGRQPAAGVRSTPPPARPAPASGGTGPRPPRSGPRRGRARATTRGAP
jgi:TetR/AcrR family transcriptional regulator